MKTSEKKLVGLRRYHVNRPVKTRLKLLEALDRMESGHTVVVGPGFNWSKTVLAREADVNINTVVRKFPGGAWAFPEINERNEGRGKDRRRRAAAEIVHCQRRARSRPLGRLYGSFRMSMVPQRPEFTPSRADSLRPPLDRRRAG